MGESISVFGLGYVGSVMVACAASKGHRVIGVDVNPDKVAMLEAGRSPVLEAGLDELVRAGHDACRLHAMTSATEAVCASNISFICVGTPSLRNGKLDFGGIERVCTEIGRALRKKSGFHTVVLRSTILPGTAQGIAIPALEASSGKRFGIDFAVCVNPEFLREGCAVADFFHPPFTIMGAAEADHLTSLRTIYEWVPGRVFETSLEVAEMVKYVCNAYHAVKVDFANEIGTLCKYAGVDAEAVTQIFTSDSKLNVSPAYLSPGFAFGGSCLPKDLRALKYLSKEFDLNLPLLESILPSNQEHLERAVEAVLLTNKKRVAMLGLSFKPGTDDLRESPQVQLIKRLLGEGCQVQIWDENVWLGRLVGSNKQYIEETIPHIGSLLHTHLEEVVRSSEVVVIGTRFSEKEKLEILLTPEQTVIDLVNLKKSERPNGAHSYQGICW